MDEMPARLVVSLDLSPEVGDVELVSCHAPACVPEHSGGSRNVLRVWCVGPRPSGPSEPELRFVLTLGMSAADQRFCDGVSSADPSPSDRVAAGLDRLDIDVAAVEEPCPSLEITQGLLKSRQI